MGAGLTHANQAFADKARPLVVLGIAGGLGGAGAAEGASAIKATGRGTEWLGGRTPKESLEVMESIQNDGVIPQSGVQ
jgi:hypothetical protein